jgi:hypothetical protein
MIYCGFGIKKQQGKTRGFLTCELSIIQATQEGHISFMKILCKKTCMNVSNFWYFQMHTEIHQSKHFITFLNTIQKNQYYLKNKE